MFPTGAMEPRPVQGVPSPYECEFAKGATVDNEQPTQHIATDKARAGSTPHVVRYVLTISMTLAVLGLLLVWAIYRH
jgi:hypothetical protein